MFTTSPRTTLYKLLHDVLRSPDPVRQISMNSSSFKKSKFLFQKCLKMVDSVFHYDKFGCCKFKYHCQKDNFSQICKHLQYCRRFQTEKSRRSGSSCDYLHPDYSKEGNKKIPNEMKINLEFF